jgi:two-component system CheB/CheR fusion protein
MLSNLEAESLNVEEQRSEETMPGTLIPVVGIGASAGGLEGFRSLFSDLRGDTGFAFVVVQHLDPNHHSLLASILGRATVMPVSEAADGERLEANHVYVIPASVDLTVSHGALKLAPRSQTAGAYMPIDRLFRSLAEQSGSRAIGIILSGTGSDGAAGVEDIKAAGGMTFAQDAESAKYPAMSQAAVATDCVDLVLSPEGIAAELGRIAGHPSFGGTGSTTTDVGSQADENRFGQILAILHESTGIDFSLYRENMVKRRILRRLALRNIKDLAEYCERLTSDPAELVALQRDLLIIVTSFFRDPAAFECLRKVAFPGIIHGRAPGDTIRIWVAGCATGEEAFSIAILLKEYLSETGVTFPVQIFASDLSSAAVEKARLGRYPESIAADLTPVRLNRFFTKIETGYQINKELREICIFTRHNLLGDPPFSRLDLISCRNVLIYLGSVQKDIIPMFHYALKRDGFLLLGASETVAFSDLFSVADCEHRVFCRRETARKHSLFPVGSRVSKGLTAGVTPGLAPAAPSSAAWGGVDMHKEIDRILLLKYSPAGIVVDDDLEVLEIRGNVSPWLTLPVGKVSFSLMKLIPDCALFLEIEKLIGQVRGTGESARQERVPFDHQGDVGAVSIEVLPLNAGRKKSVLILIEPVRGGLDNEPARITDGLPPEADPRDRQISVLKQQLADAKERFLNAIEEHQSSREESQNTTEEALSANEEMQSLNEELETAKEELQSTNEELITVNDELQARNAALAQSRDFAMSIVETVRQPLLVLDTDLRIRMANQAFYRTFKSSAAEAEGQLIFSLSRGSWDLPGLRTSLEGLLEDGNTVPAFEVEQDFPRVGRRNLVLGGCRINHLRMILLAVDDVTEHKLAQQTLDANEEHLRQSQKMEAVGRLAGGIAHDFNNLLTAIVGYSSLLSESLVGNTRAVQQVLEIRSAGEKAAALTRQLLSFSRRQVLQPRLLDLNAVISDFDKMLRSMLGERIAVLVDCAPVLWKVQADPGEIGRAIMNLWLNARDAMPAGGTLKVETANRTLTHSDVIAHSLKPGPYVMVGIHDTGLGMSAELQARIFEPFFTTKEVGSGTGLGLPTASGIVEQSGGFIRCDSVPGKGSTFRIFLPAVAEGTESGASRTAALASTPGGSEVILVVEDEDAIRKLTRVVLEKLGYVILEACNGAEGLALCKSHQGAIDLLLTDVIMPELSGRELAEAALLVRPDLKVMFMSGHTHDILLKEGVRNGTAFLQKPFTPIALAQTVRAALDVSASSAART